VGYHRPASTSRRSLLLWSPLVAVFWHLGPFPWWQDGVEFTAAGLVLHRLHTQNTLVDPRLAAFVPAASTPPCGDRAQPGATSPISANSPWPFFLLMLGANRRQRWCWWPSPLLPCR